MRGIAALTLSRFKGVGVRASSIEELGMQKENEGHLCDEDLKMSSDERTSISSTGV